MRCCVACLVMLALVGGSTVMPAVAKDVPALYLAPGLVAPTTERFLTPTQSEPPIMNPPGFRWPAVGQGVLYDIEISTDPAFASNSTVSVSDWSMNIYTPNEPFAPGVWYWHTRSYTPGGSKQAWSPVHSFTMPEGLPEVPVPPVSALVQRAVAKGHPRLYILANDLPTWRQKVKGSSKIQWNLLASRIPSALTETGDPPIQHLGVKVTDPATVDEFNAAAQYVTRVSEAMQLLALSYLFTGDKQHGEKARQLLMAIAEWDPAGPTSESQNDVSFREVIHALSRGYDWLASTDLLSATDKEKIEAAALVRGRELAKWQSEQRVTEKWPYESHVGTSLSQLGEIATVFAGHLAEADSWIVEWAHMVTANYPPYGRSDGSWSEGPNYWKWSIETHISVLNAVSAALDVPFINHPFYKNTAYWKLYVHPPWSQVGPFGDHLEMGPSNEDASVMRLLATIYGDTTLAWYAAYMRAGYRQTPKGFLAFDPALRPAPPDDLPLAQVFPDTGLVVMRTSLTDPSEDIQFMLKSNPLGSVSHAHADQGNFTLDAYGEPLVIATGYYPLYADSHHATWTWQSWAHNVPLVDGKGQASRQPGAAGQVEHFFHSDPVDYTRVDATQAYQAKTEGWAKSLLDQFVPGLATQTGDTSVTSYKRHVVFLRPDVFVMVDDLRAAQPVAFTWQLHSAKQMNLNAAPNTIVVEKGESALQVGLLVDGTVRLTQTDAFTFPPTGRHASMPNQWHLTALLPEKADRHTLVTVLLPYRIGDTLPRTTRLQGNGWVGAALDWDNRHAEVALAVSQGVPKVAGNQVPLALSGVNAQAEVLAISSGDAPWLYAAGVVQLGLSPTVAATYGVQSGTWHFTDPVDVTIQCTEDGPIIDISTSNDVTVVDPVGITKQLATGTTQW